MQSPVRNAIVLFCAASSKLRRCAEGNELARDLAHRRIGLHKIIISPHHRDNTPRQNAQRRREMVADLKAAGLSFVPVRGKWENPSGDVEHEDSFVIHARAPGDEHGAQLVDYGHHLMRKYNQDAFIHRPPSGDGYAITRQGGVERYGATRYNRDNPYGETQFRPRRPEGSRSKLTFM